MKAAIRLVGVTTAALVALQVMAAQQFPQSGRSSTRETEGLLKSGIQENTSSVDVLDSPIDPETYIVGVGDIIQVSIHSSPPVVSLIQVSGEGSAVIPLFGEATIGGRSLREAKDILRTRFNLTTTSVTLFKARKIMVRVDGTGVIPGQVSATGASRVSTIAEDVAIRIPVRPPTPQQRRIDIPSIPISLRSILLRRWNGAVLYVDLAKYRATGENKWNPHIVEGDEIIINALDEKVPTISVGGAVWLGGTIEFCDHDRIIDAIIYARGLRSHARPDSVVLFRTGSATRVLSLSSADSAIELKAGDRLWVPSSGAIVRSNGVTLSGEVVSPGSYPIEEGTTRLSDILRMAGGPTKRASLTGSTVHREFSAPQDAERERTLATRGNLEMEDTAYVRLEHDIRTLGEIVHANFESSLSSPGSTGDPLLRNGDRIQVVAKTGTVYVFGQVMNPGHHPYAKGVVVDAYVTAAGGYTDRAKKAEVVVIKRGSRQWHSPDVAVVEDGDAIWVPKKVELGVWYEYSLYAQIGGFVVSVATMIVLYIQILR